MQKNIALFLDGTWNEPGDNTNVWRLKVMLASHDANGAAQLPYYDTGVGTAAYSRLRGGTLGSGLSLNVREAYQWLVEHYDPGDNVYVFGFSRGAYTARSLTGMIMKCGLLYPGAPMTTLELFTRYQKGKDARPIYELEFARKKGEVLVGDDARLLASSRRIPIKMIGVWDTVGALGIPWTQAPLIGRGKFYFLNTNLSKLFEHAYHAVAIDEHRAPYDATLWTRFAPTAPTGGTEHQSTTAAPENVEQRWFVGAHCNVGGGYQKDELAQIPLHWLQQKAALCGLAFRHAVQLTGNEYKYSPRDSFAEFLGGAYRLVRGGKRFLRTIGSAPRAVTRGTSTVVNEVIDASVFTRFHDSSCDYKPKNLLEWAKRKSVDLGNTHGDRPA